MQRLLSGAMGALFLFTPSVLAYNVTVPVPQYREETYADYHAFALVCLIVYGGAAVGILVHWWRPERSRRTLSAGSVFWAAFTGAFVAACVALAVASVEQDPGNLWGLIVILGGVFAAIVGSGAGLVWYALRGQASDGPAR